MPKQNAIALLKADHAAVKKLFAQEQRATKQDDEKKQSIFDQIKDALTSTRLSKKRSSIPLSRKLARNTSRTKCARAMKSISR